MCASCVPAYLGYLPFQGEWSGATSDAGGGSGARSDVKGVRIDSRTGRDACRGVEERMEQGGNGTAGMDVNGIQRGVQREGGGRQGGWKGARSCELRVWIVHFSFSRLE